MTSFLDKVSFLSAELSGHKPTEVLCVARKNTAGTPGEFPPRILEQSSVLPPRFRELIDSTCGVYYGDDTPFSSSSGNAKP